MLGLQTALISAGVSAVVSFGLGYATSDYFADKTILKLTAEKLAANSAAEAQRQSLTLRAKSAQEAADAAKKTLGEIISKPPIITERVRRVPVAGVCIRPENGGDRTTEGQNKPPVVSQADSGPAGIDGRYLRYADYERVRDALAAKIAEYRPAHIAHVQLSNAVEVLPCVELVD